MIDSLRTAKKIQFPEFEMEIEAEDIECEKEKSEEEVYKDYENMLRTGQIPKNDYEDSGEYLNTI